MIKQYVEGVTMVVAPFGYIVRDKHLRVAATGVTRLRALRNFIISARYYVRIGELKQRLSK